MIVKITENELTKLIKESINDYFDGVLIDEEFNKLKITESLINETLSTIPENGWEKSLLSCLYHSILGEYKKGNIKGTLELSDLEGGKLPHVPFLNGYIISINYNFLGKLKTDGSCKSSDKLMNGKSISMFNLDIVTTTQTLLSQLYTFVYHELLHCWANHNLAKNNKFYGDLNPYHIDNNNLEFETEIKIINHILYFTNILERGAYTSEAIGELKYKYSHDSTFAELPTREQMEDLFVTKEFNKCKDYIEFLKSNLNNDELFSYVKNELQNQMNWKWKTYTSFVNMLSNRLNTSYNSYCHKVSKWLQHTRLDELITQH